jgi:hypothetical protein
VVDQEPNIFSHFSLYEEKEDSAHLEKVQNPSLNFCLLKDIKVFKQQMAMKNLFLTLAKITLGDELYFSFVQNGLAYFEDHICKSTFICKIILFN